MTNPFVRNFINGLLIVVPVGATIWAVYSAVTFIDGVLNLPIPGLGLALTVVCITLLGFIFSNVVGRQVLGYMDAFINRLPVVKLLYSSIKDLMGAFVGDKKSFDRPVRVTLGDLSVFGFVTCSHFDDPRLADSVAVYVPQSYAFAGNLLIVERSRVEPVDAEGAQFLAFIVSGGVAEMRGAKTVMDGRLVKSGS